MMRRMRRVSGIHRRRRQCLRRFSDLRRREPEHYMAMRSLIRRYESDDSSSEESSPAPSPIELTAEEEEQAENEDESDEYATSALSLEVRQEEEAESESETDSGTEYAATAEDEVAKTETVEIGTQTEPSITQLIDLRQALQNIVEALALIGFSTAKKGYFWHLTDLHLDPNYKVTSDPGGVCPSAGNQQVTDAGEFGHYLCDAPQTLIISSINAMKRILPDPDFILWTGDDTPHVPNEKLGEDAVLEIVEWLTNQIHQAFPTTKVYSALGNHDFHPKNQLPPHNNSIYNRISELWSPWLNNESLINFQKGAYYTEQIVNIGAGRRIIVLNTNLYYDSNNATASLSDPGNQFQWLDNILTNASQHGEKVYIVGHVPPGYFEKKREKSWFTNNFNQRYIEIIKKHHEVIQGQFFGHHHTDTFRMFYNDQGVPISTMFISPGVTPWKTTLPGVENGANNPGIRIFEYDRTSLQVLDMVTYYLNLTYANKDSPRWEKEYRLTEAFQVPDGSALSMHNVLEKISSDPCYLQKYYEYNSVNYDLVTCGHICRVDHICSIREVDFAKYNECLKTESSSHRPTLEISLMCIVISVYLLLF
ncbi:acid sphingomyelinase-like phosphodiesterase 3b [Bombina bombina]|uniref:acid sphingomyelinase-like phosphodiesterase 3b n=1 Tax=Bombina bombina TaxID=8345 RepID=UPI00235A8F14|nr:acid sphingomyelinase-like phosphodiesterase 3b [Bombina bombina]